MKKATKKEIKEIHDLFIEKYSDAVTELNYKNAYELVVAVALSAQCTDVRVNLITPALFAKYPTPSTLAKADIEDVKSIINSCSFFNNKAKGIAPNAKIEAIRYVFSRPSQSPIMPAKNTAVAAEIKFTVI